MSEESIVVWNKILSTIKDKVNSQSYSTWFKPVSPIAIDDGKLVVQVPSQFFYEWLEQHYGVILNQELTKLLGPQSRLVYSIHRLGNSAGIDRLCDGMARCEE